MMYCQKCGTKHDDNAFKCTHCGAVMQQAPSGKKTNTAVVILIVAGIAIGFFTLIAILAAIAIPSFVNQATKSRNAAAQIEVRSSCMAAAEFFFEHPNKTVTLDDLRKRGLASNPDIELSIENGTMENLSIRGRHKQGNRVYVADKNCNVREVRP